MLRELLAGDELLVVPGCHDALGARLIEHAGFDAAYMTGFGAAAALLGQPDVGLLSAAEMADNARRISMATALPVIADADTGYGSPLNVMRTLREYEQAGVAAIQLEDQVAPKRCGHMEGKDVVPAAAMAAKIEAAVAARSAVGQDGLVIIARTDARATEGLDAAIDRARRYAGAGADVLFLEALESVDEFEAVADADLGLPLVFNWVEGGRTPGLAAFEVADMGYRVLLLPITALLHATAAARQVLREIRETGTPQSVPTVDPDQPDPFRAFTDLVGLPEVLETQHRYRS